jgi:uncharacterized protein
VASTFLRAEWRKLLMANYAVDPKLLLPFLPAHTELDLWNNTCYVSVVGFMFVNTRIKGIKIPLHINFEEVNLRFYVRHNDNGEWKRGVVFIKELVPKPAITFVANTFYNEPYETVSMQHEWKTIGDQLSVTYQWKKQNAWQSISINTGNEKLPMAVGSEEEFITEHYWGYTRVSERKTAAYGVEHPRWEVYKTIDYTINVDFAATYGEYFRFLNAEQPKSVFLAEGSAIVVKGGRVL